MISEAKENLSLRYSLIEASLVSLLALSIYFINFLRNKFSEAPISYAILLAIIFAATFFSSFSKMTKKKSFLVYKYGAVKKKTEHSLSRWLIISSSILFYLSVSRDLSISRFWLLSFIITLLPFIIILDYKVKNPLISILKNKYRKNKNKDNVLLVGSSKWINNFSQKFKNKEYSSNLDIKGHYIIDNDIVTSELLEWIRDSNPDLLILSDELIESNVIELVSAMSDRRGFRLAVELSSLKKLQREFTLDNYGEYHISIASEPSIREPSNRFLKRLMDIAISIPIIILILPILYILVLLIQVLARSSGGVFYKQTRLGRGAKEFEVLKFRTMNLGEYDESLQATQKDPRIYPGGNLLRKLNVDEFPQFINVLRGEMSVVGPRPHLENHERQFEDTYRKYGLRRLAKPGITGLAQVTGLRGEVKKSEDILKRAQVDIKYIDTWSIFLDVKIIFLTFIQCIVPNKNAY